MATANIDLRDGTKIVIEGTAEEIARVLELYGGNRSSVSSTSSRPNAVHSDGNSAPANERRDISRRDRSGVMQHIRTLIEEGFFTERRGISDVQVKLEEGGRIYPVTHLSTPLRRLVVNRELRRLRDGKNWVYVNAK